MPCIFLQNEQSFHGDIRPVSILLTDEGLPKISDRTLMDLDFNAMSKVFSKNSPNIFLSPLQMKGLAEKNLKPAHNPFKTDIYCLGMTILQAATLQDSLDLYNFKNGTINHMMLNSRIADVRSRYSYLLADILSQMLFEDENKRIDYNLIFSLITPYRLFFFSLSLLNII